MSVYNLGGFILSIITPPCHPSVFGKYYRNWTISDYFCFLLSLVLSSNLFVSLISFPTDKYNNMNMKHETLPTQQPTPHDTTPSATCVRSTEPYPSAANAAVSQSISFSRMTEPSQLSSHDWYDVIFLFSFLFSFLPVRKTEYVCMDMYICRGRGKIGWVLRRRLGCSRGLCVNH